MGAGKTTYGLKLAHCLNFDFIDLDAQIVELEGKSISRIFKEKGEKYFRSVEAENLRSLDGIDNVVISLGGGAPCFHDNIKWMNDHGLTIYLKLDAKSIYSRLSNAKSERPLISDKSKTEIQDYINTTLTEREVFYEQAKIVIEAKNLKIKKLLSIVEKQLILD